MATLFVMSQTHTAKDKMAKLMKTLQKLLTRRLQRTPTGKGKSTAASRINKDLWYTLIHPHPTHTHSTIAVLF